MTENAFQAADSQWQQSDALPQACVFETLRLFNPCSLQDKFVPTRQWAVLDWMPWRNTTAFYGDGGTGKSLLAQMLATSAATGNAWLGLDVKRCRVLGVFCEDDDDELHRRQADINAAMGLDFTDLSDFKWISRVGEDNLLMTFDAGRNDGVGRLTPFWHSIVTAGKDFGAQLIILDTAADCFGGNENVRSHVRQFVQRACTGLALALDGAVLLCAHPSVAGINSGEGTGGSTGWNNSVRSRLYLTRPAKAQGEDDAPNENARILEKRKANYAKSRDRIEVEWKHGFFHVKSALKDMVAYLEQNAKEKSAQEAFLLCLDESARQERYVTDGKTSPRYAPKIFASMKESGGFRAKELEAAMYALFNNKTIKNGSAKGADRHNVKTIVRELPIFEGKTGPETDQKVRELHA